MIEKTDVVEFYIEDEVGIDVLRAFVGRQDAESVRAAKALLEDGEQLAQTMAQLEE